MSDIKISVIMPVYKVEEYVGKAIESIQAQTLKEWEFLIVDDGTPDRSGEICDEYASKDARLHVIHKEMAARRARVMLLLTLLKENICILWILMTGQSLQCWKICINLQKRTIPSW